MHSKNRRLKEQVNIDSFGRLSTVNPIFNWGILDQDQVADRFDGSSLARLLKQVIILN
jgi:hypothetical protein